MILVLIGVATLLLCYIYLIKPHRQWKDRGVPQTNPTFILGDTWENFFRRKSFVDVITKLYNDAGENRYYGLYQTFLPTLLIKDLDLLKQIGVKDFDHFQDHRPFIPENNDMLWEKNLFALRGQKWKDMRATLSPSFTSSKMRTIFTIVSECGEEFTKHFLLRSDDELNSLEMKDTFTRFGNDVIASVAFGIKCDSLGQRDNTFYLMGKAATNFSSPRAAFTIFMMLVLPKLSKFLNLKLFTEKVSNFFRNIVTRTIKTREENNIVRPDMLQLLMEARKNGMKYEEQGGTEDAGFATVEESDIGKSNKHITYKLTDDDITAQGLIFFFAGFDTVSTAMSYMSYELALHPDIQERLIQEVDETFQNCRGKLTYEALVKMKYMDMVLSETLRKYPPAPAVDRIVTKPYTIQPTNDHEEPVHLKLNDVLWIPIHGLHHDPRYYPNPEKFDPERFSDENKHNIHPYTFLPFGVGPRNCIGSRFALLEVKTVMFYLLSKFELTVTEKTQIPMKYCKKPFSVDAEKGIWVALKRRDK